MMNALHRMLTFATSPYDVFYAFSGLDIVRRHETGGADHPHGVPHGCSEEKANRMDDTSLNPHVQEAGSMSLNP